uniref:F-box/kelch-repeat protein At3g23880-like n=1 Tax=Fragaria vesca subsp. vesca TaxID=101020 RepID=UPI0005CB6090|nr:PREDICTED: F-box/kelch-repeat protein At3g23880-like [Fragaria vesca subsp. vesca]XP_011467091.1 PREDICTED: F-box/kelch-repeat protein At3g23880-like [Fragaria vesca subsp. vesca]XP_011467095.1 PREDICTED: F-box/kelch-repeat protein At3g23880-like [Fragaria vesca subsp. vesca]
MSDFLPQEIIHRILLHLPVKSLIRSTLVCKSWKSLIKCPDFIESHLSTTIVSNDEKDSHLLLLSASSEDGHTRHQHHSLRWDSPEFGAHSMLPTPVIYLENKPVSDLGVVGTCNGLVCLEIDRTGTGSDPMPVLIWNPSIRRVVMVPKPPLCSISTDDNRYTTLGFGYAAHSNDYKILRVVTDVTTNVDYDSIDEIFGVVNFADDDRLITTFVQVYSLASGSWKSLSDSVVPLDLKGGGNEDFVFVNDTLHKLEARFNEDEDEGEYYNDEDMVIRTFNLSTEEFGEMMGPEALEQGRCSIARYGDSLAFGDHYDNGLRDRGCDIWVMRQYGVAESWTKLFKIYVDPARIHGFKRCGDVVLEKKISFGQSRLTSYNPNKKQYSDLGTVGHSYYFMDSFIESLVLLDHCNAISYQVAGA